MKLNHANAHLYSENGIKLSYDNETFKCIKGQELFCGPAVEHVIEVAFGILLLETKGGRQLTRDLIIKRVQMY